MPKSQTKIENVNALVELEKFGVKVEKLSEDEVRLCCPVHEDKTPSVNLNLRKNLWNCKAAQCLAKGDIISLLAHIAKVERTTMIVELSKRYDLKSLKVIDQSRVEAFHKEIWGCPHMQALRDRGITDDLIRQARLGYYDGRITIPVFDLSGNCINVRRYLPGAPGPEKMRNTPGYGDPKIYQIEQTKYDQLWICGGEMKALIAAKFLNPHGIGAISVTAGEGAWDHITMTPLMKDKRVYICMDVDFGGKAAVASIASQIFFQVMSVYVVQLPLDRTKYPKGDINDWVAKENAGEKEFLDCVVAATRWYPPEQQEEIDAGSQETRKVRLTDATNPNYIGQRVQVEAIVTAMDQVPFIIPKAVGIVCSRDQPGCAYCPVKPLEVNPDKGYVELSIKGISAHILEMVNAPKSAQRDAIREGLRIPACKAVEFKHVKEHFEVVDVRLAPQITISTEAAEHIVQPALCIGHGLETNTPYILEGRLHPHPKTQQAVLLIDKWRQAEDNLSSFTPTGEQLETLQILKPLEWSVEGIQDKLDSIYQDFEANVTRIYKRRDLHLTVDLCYHSALLFMFDGQVTKGWVNNLILGDSSQGKSDTTQRMMSHYKLGEKIECKNSTKSGLIGGLQQLQGRWFITWGVIPRHDRRLVNLEEVKGTPIDVISRLTDMRSSGVAEISGIENRRTNARTRLLWTSNPRSDRPLSAYNFGLEAIQELVGGLEDVRRFDFAILVSAQQINAEEINQLSASRPNIEHQFTSDICRRAVLWAWTRKPDQISFESDATNRVLEGATHLCGRYTEAVPLIDRGSMRHKLARLAVALAARTFSTNTTNEEILVRKCHVDYIIEFIDRTYSSPIFGYLDYSKAQLYANKVSEPHIVKKHIVGTKHPQDFINQMLHTDEITLNDIRDWCDVEQDTAQKTLSFLVRKHALRRTKNLIYSKTSEFITLLKEMQSEGTTPSEARVDQKESVM